MMLPFINGRRLEILQCNTAAGQVKLKVRKGAKSLLLPCVVDLC